MGRVDFLISWKIKLDYIYFGIFVTSYLNLPSTELPSSHSNILHDGTSGSSSLGYSSNHHQGSQQFAGGTAGDMRSINEDFQDSSQVDIGQHTGQEPPNPRSKYTFVLRACVCVYASVHVMLDVNVCSPTSAFS